MPIILTILLFFGFVTYYHQWYEGRETANGEIFLQEGLTAASITIPLGTKVRITNLKNLKSVTVRINDTGRLKYNQLDLSKRAFRQLGNLSKGVIKVKYEILNNNK